MQVAARGRKQELAGLLAADPMAFLPDVTWEFTTAPLRHAFLDLPRINAISPGCGCGLFDWSP